MKKAVSGAVAIGLMLAAVSWFVAPDEATAQVPGFLTLEGPGSAIGVSVRESTDADAKAAGLPQPDGVVLESVRTGSPAEKAGFRAGDIVLEFDGERVRSVRHFTRLVRESPPQRRVSAVVLRGTARQTLEVIPEVTGDFRTDARGRLREGRLDQRNLLRDFNFDIAPQLRRGRLFGGPTLGLTLTPLTDQLAEHFGVKEGALVMSVESGSAAADAGIRAGDVVTAVAGRSVRSAADVLDALRRSQPGDGIDINVSRDRKSLMLKATLPTPARPATPPGRRGLPV